MATILNITTDDILALGDEDLRELVARLAEAELSSAGHSPSAVTWGGNQNASDGGIDVRVGLDNCRTILGFVPRTQTGYQVKAEDFPRGKIVDEMIPNGSIRTAIVDLAKRHGSYIIVSSKGSLTESALSDRRSAMQECLTQAGINSPLHVDFYDRRRIASWVEQHPSLTAWVREKVGRSISGWQPYAAWAYGEDDLASKYVTDDAVKIFTPNLDTPVTIVAAIDRLRRDLAQPRASIRLTGLSGVGKTRLVQALFDPTIETDAIPLDRNAVVYTDLADEPDPVPQAMIDMLLSRGDSTLIIVDNCGADLHGRLTEKTKQSRSNLALLTIEYDIRDDAPEGTLCYRLEPSSDELIKAIVKRRYQVLTVPDIDKIAEFSSGNARVAFALASTSSAGGELAKLEDRSLFLRLFHQVHQQNHELLRAAETCSLLYSFHGEATSGEGAEIPLLAELANTSNIELYAQVEELRRRGLVQSRGPWRAVLPHAIANRLAQRALQDYPPQFLIARLVDEAPDRIARSFSRRIGYLHQEPIARTIAVEWLSPNGRLGDVTRLTDLGREMFSNLAPVAPAAALGAVIRATMNADFVSTQNHDRSRFIRLVRSIAYDPDHFQVAVECLGAFASVEPDGYNNDPAMKAIASLFQLHISGTDATPEPRADATREMLNSINPSKVRIGLACLDAALEASHFNSSYSADFGARKRSYGWYPRTQKDVEAWFHLYLDIAQEVVIAQPDLAPRVKQILGDQFRALWFSAGVHDRLEEVARALHQSGGWPEGWRATKQTLRYDAAGLSPEAHRRLTALERYLRPDDLLASVRGRIFTHDVLGVDEEKQIADDAVSAFERARTIARELGRQVGHDQVVFDALLGELVIKNTSNSFHVWDFGLGVGETVEDPQVWIDRIKDALSAAPEDKRSIYFFVPFLHTAHARHREAIERFFDQALQDPIYGPYFPSLQCAVNLDARAVERLHQSLELGVAPTLQFCCLAGGRATDALSVDQVESLIMAIGAKENAQANIVEILGMVVHCADRKDHGYKEELRGLCRRFLTRANWTSTERYNDHIQHGLKVIINFAIDGDDGAATAANIHRAIVQARADDARSQFDASPYLAPFMKRHPATMLDEIFVPDKGGSYEVARRALSSEWSHRIAAIDAAPATSVIEWCKRDPELRIPFIASCHQAFPDTDQKAAEWSELALELLRRATDKAEVLRIFVGQVRPRSWSGSRAVVVRQRIKLIDELPVLVDEITAQQVAPIREQLERFAKHEEESERLRDRNRDERFE